MHALSPPLPRPSASAPPNFLAPALYSNGVVRCNAVPGPNRPAKAAPYKPSVWDLRLLESLNTPHAPKAVHEERADWLEKQVISMIEEKQQEPHAMLELIDSIRRLGLGYRFQNPIAVALHRFHSDQPFPPTNQAREIGLHATALRFRILRQHGFHVSQDVFKGFTDGEGRFLRGTVGDDVRGLESLLEACHVGFDGENILEAGMAFAATRLKQLGSERGGDDWGPQVWRALEAPPHRQVPRLEARWNIEWHSRRQRGDGPDPALLRLARLDFNAVQSVLQADLQHLVRWWKEARLVEGVGFARERVMECFFWAVGMVFRPDHSFSRLHLTKVTLLITVIDDLFDVSGDLHHLRRFTLAVRRWDRETAERLPEWMKPCFFALHQTVHEIADATLARHGHDILPHLTKMWTDLFEAFLVEVRWSIDGETPPFRDYFKNGWMSVSGSVILVHSYLSLPEFNHQALQMLKNYHDIIHLPSIIFRLWNDLGTSKAEMDRGESANAISCYMKDHNVSEEDARRSMREMIECTWRKMNYVNYSMNNSSFPSLFIEMSFNLARISQCTYQYGDSHGAPDARSKNVVASVILDPIY